MNMPIKFCSQSYFFQTWGSLMSLKSQTRDPQLKVLPGVLVLRIFTSWKKSIVLSRVWTRETWISRRTRYPETTEADLRCTKSTLQSDMNPIHFYLCLSLEWREYITTVANLISACWVITKTRGKTQGAVLSSELSGNAATRPMLWP